MLQAVSIAGGLSLGKAGGEVSQANPSNMLQSAPHSLTTHDRHGATLGKTWCRSRDKLTGEKGEMLISIQGNLQFPGLWEDHKSKVLEGSRMTQGEGSENQAA